MQPKRKRKLIILLWLASILSLATALILYALRQNINLFYTPTEIVTKNPTGHLLRLGGMVVKGSIIREKGLQVRFKITDFKSNVEVFYQGILPDLFREGQGVVTEGVLLINGHFKAQTVLAKHDENYMPPEVKEALKTRNTRSNRQVI